MKVTDHIRPEMYVYRKRRQSWGVAGAPAAAAQLLPKMDNVAVPVCTGCGTQVSADVRALQCDRCGDPNK